MKRIFQYPFQTCLSLMLLVMASCNDELLPTGKNSNEGNGFRLTVTQATPSRLALGQDGLTLQWEPEDQLVLVDKARVNAPIYLVCDLEEPASSATFFSESGVPPGDYWVIYNYNGNLEYTNHTSVSVNDINKDDYLVLYGSLNVGSNTSTATVALSHLYTKINLKLKNSPKLNGDISYYECTVGMYSSKKGISSNRELTPDGFIVPSQDLSQKKYNLGLGYCYTDDGSDYVVSMESRSALIFPEDFSDEDLFFYVTFWNEDAVGEFYECYEIKKSGVNLLAGVNYTVELDLSTAAHSMVRYNDDYVGEISKPEGWRSIVYNGLSSVKLTQNLDFADECFFPLQGASIDGNGMKISNVELIRPDEDCVGLIKSNGAVVNLTLENAIITGRNGVGAFVGSGTTLSGCKLVGNSIITGKDYVGGFSGTVSSGSYNSSTLSNLTVDGNCQIIGENYVGGIVGFIAPGGYSYYYSQKVLDVCVSAATVTATGDYVGGIFGKMGGNEYEAYTGISLSDNETLTLSKCKNKGSVTGRYYVGGIGGDFAIFDSNRYYNESVTNSIELKESYSEGNVTGEKYVGGIVGNTYAPINHCYSINTIKGTDDVGGIAGMVTVSEGGYYKSTVTIKNCYSLAELSVGTDAVAGGIIGLGDGGYQKGVTVANCYFAGTNPTTSGIIGYSKGSSAINQCLTTLSTLGVNLWDTSITEEYPNTISSDSKVGVTSILSNIDIINGESAYSTNVWSNYLYDCIKLANLLVDTDAPDFESDKI